MMEGLTGQTSIQFPELLDLLLGLFQQLPQVKAELESVEEVLLMKAMPISQS